LSAILIAIATAVVFAEHGENLKIPNLFPFPDSSGVVETFSSNGSIDLSNPFFQSLGTNGRACVSCHLPDQGWSIAADRVQLRFHLTAGKDPIFRTNDGSNCDHNIDTSTLAGRRQAYSLLTSRGLIRIAIDVPAGAEFEVADVNLDKHGATGGPVQLARQKFFVGINDSLGGNPFGTAFTPLVFDVFQSWSNLDDDARGAVARAAIARGERLFNSKPIDITGVGGLNDDLGLPHIPGTCGTCHDSPNIGNHSLPVPLNIGVGDLNSPLDVSYLPVITLRNKTTRQIVQTTDPGRALISGKWKDIGRLKGPILRGLASRAPYFHNGSAKTLADAVNFYNGRFNMDLTAQDKADLVAFLSSL